MTMEEILHVNSIPALESELKNIHENQFKTVEDDELITLFLREMLVRVRIKQIEHILHS
ncbi:hypothetical protein [Ammoniphilus sp. CFH 90114]|uniref:hypothetical protein n=1 Tax=Ammoniphilus sp. CFH 90114 TaxID=2493665 RepID=UPI0013E90C90|nr:hypothetical protein [Ammoniphilus sp. CFH 90114]